MPRRLAAFVMILVADTHVHFYPSYDLSLALRCGMENLSRLARGVDGPMAKALFLVERRDCRFFAELADGRRTAAGFVFESAGHGLLWTDSAEHGRMLLVAGRQIITAERLEVLALCCPSEIADGMPFSEVLEQIRDREGVPVLSWAPGKWFFKRGKIIRSAVESQLPGTILLGDTTLRPKVIPLSPLVSVGRRRGHVLIAGSDPLPFAGEERWIGRYATAFALGAESPSLENIRQALLKPERTPQISGERGSLCQTLLRIKQNQAVRLR